MVSLSTATVGVRAASIGLVDAQLAMLTRRRHSPSALKTEELFPEPSSTATFGRGGAVQGRVNQTLTEKYRIGGRAVWVAALALWLTARGLAALAAAFTSV
jgi:hypothetical protein